MLESMDLSAIEGFHDIDDLFAEKSEIGRLGMGKGPRFG